MAAKPLAPPLPVPSIVVHHFTTPYVSYLTIYPPNKEVTGRYTEVAAAFDVVVVVVGFFTDARATVDAVTTDESTPIGGAVPEFPVERAPGKNAAALTKAVKSDAAPFSSGIY